MITARSPIFTAFAAALLSLAASCGPSSKGAADADAGVQPDEQAQRQRPGSTLPSQGSKPTPRGKLSPLPPDQRRAAVFVLPGDALVDVDGKPARRRNGVIDLSGKVGQKFTMRVTKGSKAGEATIAIGEEGASPSEVKLDDLKPAAVVRGARAPAAKPPWRAGSIDD